MIRRFMEPYVLFGALALVLAVSACDKGDESGEGGAEGEAAEAEGGGAAEEEAAPAVDASDPDALGVAIGERYVNVMNRLREMVADRPDIATLRPQLEALKEENIQAFVALGHHVAALDEAQVQRVHSGVRRAMNSLPDFQWFNDAMGHYQPQDFEFGQFLGTFNILSQYAFFDLLRQQAPEEADRLGLP